MSSSSEKTGRIAKNTFMLYIRMGVVMLITFWTSRIVLEKLGEDDFGIYSVVGGVVVLFAFLNGALTQATQRFLNFELGKRDFSRLSKVFSTSFAVHIAIALLVLVLAETLGVWFLNTQLNIPAERMAAANWVYRLSVAGTLVGILRTPYNAAVIAYERMSFLAYLSIGESVGKFVILFFIGFGGFDKLVFYAALMLAVLVLSALINVAYCCRAFPQIVKLRVPRDASLFREILSFSGWQLISGVATLSSSQGVNMVLNIFCGVAVNAAMGIANQVSGAVYQFVANFQTAFSPQITKSYAENDKAYFMNLIFRSSKISYFMMFFIALPVWLNADFLLGLWLVDVPAHTCAFVQLTIILSMIDALNGPLWMSIGATGNIRTYAICVSSLNLLNLPLAYFALRAGMAPESVLVIRIGTNLLMMGSRLIILRKAILLPVRSYLSTVCVPVLLVSALAIPMPMLVGTKILNSWTQFFSTSATAVVISAPVIWFLGLNASERAFFRQAFLSLRQKFGK